MKRLALLLASAALASPAFAADVVYEEPAAPMAIVAPVSNWTGLYLGVQGGGAFNPDNGDNLAIVPNFAGAGATFLTNAFGNNFSSEFERASSAAPMSATTTRSTASWSARWSTSTPSTSRSAPAPSPTRRLSTRPSAASTTSSPAACAPVTS